MDINIFLFGYKYMEYEKELLKREIESLIPNAILENDGQTYVLRNICEENLPLIDRLTYVKGYSIGNDYYLTLQGKLEESCTDISENKQSTRYSTNGLHEYKGKFNPQIVHAILNVLKISNSDRVLDPFCGSGTTLLECEHMGIHAEGTDINPLAAYIANTKIKSLSIDTEYTLKFIKNIVESIKQNKHITQYDSDDRMVYLSHWIPEETLMKLEFIRNSCAAVSDAISDFIKVLTSDLIRDYSNQEPSDLRIRKRISPFPTIPFEEALMKNAIKYLERINNVNDAITTHQRNTAHNIDIRNANEDNFVKFDAAITSPPYATALPYIDTQRISLVWLGMISASEIKELEATLIGSREILNSEKAVLSKELSENAGNLPDELYELIIQMKSAINEKDGFRKQAVPVLLYRYFCDMQQMFVKTRKLIKCKGKFALVVGHNKTTLGGIEYQIDTPFLLSVLAENVGWKTIELFPLQTYKRYGLNNKNAITKESLIILERG